MKYGIKWGHAWLSKTVPAEYARQGCIVSFGRKTDALEFDSEKEAEDYYKTQGLIRGVVKSLNKTKEKKMNDKIELLKLKLTKQKLLEKIYEINIILTTPKTIDFINRDKVIELVKQLDDSKECKLAFACREVKQYGWISYLMCSCCYRKDTLESWILGDYCPTCGARIKWSEQ